MLNVRRNAAFSVDPSARRSQIRERWIPTEAGDGDLRPRTYPAVSAGNFEDSLRREKDDSVGQG
jgi:hypothetical protein